MEVSLKTFVAETLKEIVEGVKDAQSHVIELDENQVGSFFIGGSGYRTVEFDISVTSSESSDKTGKAGLMIKVVDLGVKSTSTNLNSAVNRIKFTVPVSFPEKGNYRTSR